MKTFAITRTMRPRVAYDVIKKKRERKRKKQICLHAAKIAVYVSVVVALLHHVISAVSRLEQKSPDSYVTLSARRRLRADLEVAPWPVP